MCELARAPAVDETPLYIEPSRTPDKPEVRELGRTHWRFERREPRKVGARSTQITQRKQREGDATTGTTITTITITTGSSAAATTKLISHYMTIMCPSSSPKCGKFHHARPHSRKFLPLFRYNGNFSPLICTKEIGET